MLRSGMRFVILPFYKLLTSITAEESLLTIEEAMAGTLLQWALRCTFLPVELHLDLLCHDITH